MSLEDQFTATLWRTYEIALEHGYRANFFRQMLEEMGGVQTAKRLLSSRNAQTGMFQLWELGLLNETLEAKVLLERYHPLFTEEEIAEAHRRLEELGYFDR